MHDLQNACEQVSTTCTSDARQIEHVDDSSALCDDSRLSCVDGGDGENDDDDEGVGDSDVDAGDE